MDYTLKATRITLTPTIREYVDKKLVQAVEWLTKREDSSAIALAVEVAKSTHHHQKGAVWYAEATLGLRGRTLRAEAYGESIQEAIDLLQEELEREIKQYKGRAVTRSRRSARRLKEKTRVS